MKEKNALEKALAAGAAVLRSKFGRVSYRLKGRANLITEADLRSQAAVKSAIKSFFPDDGFMAEEDSRHSTGRGRIWVIDPLDGTTNYAHGFPAAAVSVALVKDGTVLAGGVADPFRRETFTAVRGRGAFIGRRRLKVSSVPSVTKALLVTGFPYDRREKAGFYCSFFMEFMKISHDVRRMGAAALDMAWLAAGRTDGYWEFGLNPWDVAAGRLLVEEAGGMVTDFSGKPWRELRGFGARTLATNGLIHGQMLRRIRAVAGRLGAGAQAALSGTVPR